MYKNPRDGPLRIQRSMSVRSFVAQKSCPSTRSGEIKQQQQQQQQQQQLQLRQLYLQQQQNSAITNNGKNNNNNLDLNSTHTGNSGRYALVPVEELSNSGVQNGRYAIVPGPNSIPLQRRYAKSQENLDKHQDVNSFHTEHVENEEFISLPPVFKEENENQRIMLPPIVGTKIKHAFSSDFGSKSFLIVDKNSNQRYQMVPTAEDEELVDDNQEIIQMHNGRAHRYAVIPTDYDEDDDEYKQLPEVEEEEEETCLSNTDLNQSQNFLAVNYDNSRHTMRTSTPQKGVSMSQLPTNYNYSSTPLKNPAATKMLHDLLSTPRKPPLMRSVQSTPRKIPIRSSQIQNQHRLTHNRQHSQSQHLIYNDPALVPTQQHKSQRIHYEPVHAAPVYSERMAVITPRVAGSKCYIEEEDCSSIQGRNNSSYPEKVVNATITLAIISLMLVLGSAMNSGLIIYMIAHFGKSFYLQFSLVSAFCGVGLGILGFRSRKCEWLPNRSYTSGYILVTMFCLLKCCGLLVILVLEPYPGLPLHDVTTGVILGLSTFSMFFIGLGVIGSLWCYRPPPDNRVNIA